MLKKLAVPFFVLSLAAFGCSSSSSNSDGGAGKGGSGGKGGSTGGSGGSTGGSSGGSGGSTGGSGGATGGSGGATGGSGGATGGTDGGTGGTKADGGGDAPMSEAGGDVAGGETGNAAQAAAAKAMCPTKTSATSDAFNPAEFCALFQETCGATASTAALKGNECNSTYTGWTDTQKKCRSYHLCNATTSAANATTHCPHAEGMATPGVAGGPCP